MSTCVTLRSVGVRPGASVELMGDLLFASRRPTVAPHPGPVNRTPVWCDRRGASAGERSAAPSVADGVAAGVAEDPGAVGRLAGGVGVVGDGAALEGEAPDPVRRRGV